MKTKCGLFLVCAALVATLSFSMVPSLALADELAAELIAKEKASWDAWEQGDMKAFRASFTEDAVYVAPGGSVMSGVETIVAEVENHGCDVRSLDFADFQVRQLSSDAAVLTFTVTQDVTCQGQILPGTIFVTSVYVRQGGEWLVTNYQETALE